MSENITISGRQVFINVPVSWKNPANKYTNGRVKLVSEGVQSIDKKEGSWTREKNPGVQFGTQTGHGHATIVLNLDELRLLAYRASTNATKRAKQGPAKAQFFGTLTFEEEKA